MNRSAAARTFTLRNVFIVSRSLYRGETTAPMNLSWAKARSCAPREYISTQLENAVSSIVPPGKPLLRSGSEGREFPMIGLMTVLAKDASRAEQFAERVLHSTANPSRSR